MNSRGLPALNDLIAASFSREEIERVAQRLDHDADLTSVLPGQIASRAQYAQAFVRAVLDRGLLDRAFFDLLIEERPHKCVDIEEVARLCLDSAVPQRTPADSPPSPRKLPPTPSRRIPMFMGIGILMFGSYAYYSFGRSFDREARTPALADDVSVNLRLAEGAHGELEKKPENIPPPGDARNGPPVKAPPTNSGTTIQKKEDPWAAQVLAALRAARVDTNGTPATCMFQVVVCADGTIERINIRGGSGDKAVEGAVARAVKATALPPPPAEIVDQLGGSCKKIPYVFTWRHTGKTSTVE